MPEARKEVYQTGNTSVPEAMKEAHQNGNTSVPEAMKEVYQTGNTSVPEAMKEAHQNGNTSVPEAMKEAHQTGNTSVPEDRKEAHQTRNTSVPEARKEAHQTGNTSVPEDRKEAHQTGNTSVPEARKEAHQTGNTSAKRKRKTIEDKVFKMISCNCKHQCKNVPLVDRKTIFKKFWSCGSWQERSNFILQTVAISKPERSMGPTSRKQTTRIYSLAGQRVCKPVYLGTLAISHTRVNYCVKHKNRDGICTPDKRGKKTPANKTLSSTVNHVKLFLVAYPKYVPHHNNSQKQYFCPNTSIKKLHSEYLSKFPTFPVSLTIFQRMFKEMNINIYKPKTDTCPKCDYLQHNISKTEDIATKVRLIKERDMHHARAKRAREELKSATANESLNVLAFTFDMQKIQPIPFIQTSTVYCKSQLSIYNLGINTLWNKQGHMMLWSENEAGKGTDEVCSSIYKFLRDSNMGPIDKVLTFSDASGGQNRNKAMLSFIMYACNKFKISEWVHRYMEPGHSYLPNDSDFGLIERKKSKQNVYCLDDWIKIVESANSNNPFITTKMAPEFRDVGSLVSQRHFKQLDEAGYNFNFMNLSWFSIKQNSDTVEYGNNDDVEGQRRKYKCPLKRNKELPVELAHLSSCRKISKAKYDDLCSLLQYIPEQYHNFYENLSHE